MASRVSTIFWGTNYENTLSLGYPLFSVLTDREPRAGSEWVQGVGGAEDAWLTGFDYTLECEARWLPVTPNFYGANAPNPLQSAVSGPTGVQAFLDWARAKNAFRFVPDITTPLFYVDGCYLVEPTSGGRSITASIDFAQTLKIRNPTMDFLQALRGIMFEYAPGADISALGMNGTFSRASVATYIGADGLLHTAAINELRDRHYIGVVRTTLVEAARINVVLWNRDLTNAAWTKVSVTPVKDQVGIDGVAASASRITATGANGTCLQAITLGSSARYQTAYVKRLVGSGVINMTLDNGATWTAIVPTAAWTRVTIPTQTLANPTVGFRIVTNGDSIAVDYVQNETGLFPTSAIATTTGAVPRIVDSLTFPWTFAPQAAALYAKLIEVGAILAVGGNAPTVLQLGSFGAAPAWRQLLYYNGSGNHYSFTQGNSAGGVSAAVAADPALGQGVEEAGLIAVNGAVTLLQSIAGAADTSSGASAAVPMPSTFNQLTIQVGDTSYPETVLAVVGIKIIAGAAISTIAQARAA